MKLSLRDLFWLVLVVACICGWGVTYRNMSHDRQLIVQAIHDAGFGLGTFDGITGPTGYYLYDN